MNTTIRVNVKGFQGEAEAIPLLWLPILVTNILQFSRASQKKEIAATYWPFGLAIVVAIFITSMFGRKETLSIQASGMKTMTIAVVSAR